MTSQYWLIALVGCPAHVVLKELDDRAANADWDPTSAPRSAQKMTVVCTGLTMAGRERH